MYSKKMLGPPKNLVPYAIIPPEHTSESLVMGTEARTNIWELFCVVYVTQLTL
jgi:hypothetical protein